jgi:small GTP-binding protein
MLERFTARKETVTAKLRELARIAGELGMRSVQSDIEGVRLPKLAEERFNLVVLGEFNHGKTTFVNALLGKPVLPTGITPTTATINHILYAEAPRARAVLLDGGVVDVDPAALADYVTLDGAHSAGIRYVELGYPAEILRDRITLVDTPGVNDLNEARAEITYSYIPRADAVIFLLDSTQVLKRSERIFIMQRILRRSRDKLVFVLGKADLLSAEELEQARAFAQEGLRALGLDPVLFPLSPRLYLQGEQERSGMAPFLEFLRRYLDAERGRILIDNVVGDGLRTVSVLRSNLGVKRAALRLGEEELARRVAEVRERLAGSQRTLDENHQRIATQAEAIKAVVRLDLKEFADGFCAAVGQEIDRADASDIKRYLQHFVQDKFKEWAEAEGEKASRMLEELAEEIIQITNENVRGVMDAVGRGFGPAETRVDLEVDTLRYDVGVFALGALGTTVFLFVNTFVGGLLTLAAPILAVVVREKVGAKIKSQAREKSPEVIRRAADAIRPRFEEIVDQFAQRLEEFVRAAGDALHRGISEVLDQALSERQRIGQDAEATTRAIDEVDGRLAALEKELAAARADLWTDEGAAADPGIGPSPAAGAPETAAAAAPTGGGGPVDPPG